MKGYEIFFKKIECVERKKISS